MDPSIDEASCGGTTVTNIQKRLKVAPATKVVVKEEPLEHNHTQRTQPGATTTKKKLKLQKVS